MKNLNLYIEYNVTESCGSFGKTLQLLLSQLTIGDRTPVRFVFFGIPQSNELYSSELAEIQQQVNLKFGKHMPVISYVAQKPLCNNALVLESHWTMVTAEKNVHYKNLDGCDYITIENSASKNLSIGGITADNNELSIYAQSVEVFEKIRKIMEHENMPIDCIVRQWNYIADITKVAHGKQHYQEFNNARSEFYNHTQWTNGYPAATGIGTYTGGVVVEVFAVKPKSTKVDILAVDNKLQIPPHAYSQSVLVGQEDKIMARTTPKFERAKVLNIAPEALVYISGTAAIRGEVSLEAVGVCNQTTTTLENIFFLISEENLRHASAQFSKLPSIKNLRIYLKEPAFYDEAKAVVEQLLPDIPSVYLLGDICRDNLLIEIEGIATNF